jgi:hypothetical protein
MIGALDACTRRVIYVTVSANVETVLVHYGFERRFVRGVDMHRARR